MKFLRCKNCGTVWLPKREEKTAKCIACGQTEAFQLGNITAYQCKNRSPAGVILLDCDGSKKELRYSWDQFNQCFEFVDTAQYWARKLIK